MDLAVFLSDLADRVERQELSTSQLQRVSEFYMSYTNLQEDSEVNTRENLMKFYILGWYIYTQLLRQQPGENELII